MPKPIKIILSASIFLILFVGFFHKINAITQDLGRHLIMGQIILQTHNVPATNLFSYTYPDFPFINHHWLSEVFFYLVFKLSGFNGLLVFSTLIVLTAFFLVFSFSSKRVNFIALSLVSLLYFRVLFERTDLRPEVFSFLFLSIFIMVLYKYKEKFTRWIYILPLIELLWVNIHIYFFIGIAVLSFFLIDYLITNRKNIFAKSVKIFAFVFFLTILASLINPSGIDGALYPLRVFGNYGYAIEENQNIFFLWNLFQKPTVPYLVTAIFFLFTVLILNVKKTKLIDWILALFFSTLSIVAVRNFPLFVFGTFIIFVKNLSFIFEKGIFTQKVNNLIAVGIFLIVFWQITQLFSPQRFGFGMGVGAQKAADFFLENNLKGPVFNNFNIGSYLDYRFYPKEKVFVDGRPEAYPADFFKKIYIPMQEDPKIFDEIDKKYNFQLIFFAHTDQTPWAALFISHIVNNPNWKMIYLDDYVVILVKSANNNIFPQKIGINNNDVFSLLSQAVFFQKAGWTKQEVQALEKILLLDPNFCPALYRLTTIYSLQNNPQVQIYSFKLQNFCR